MALFETIFFSFFKRLENKIPFLQLNKIYRTVFMQIGIKLLLKAYQIASQGF